MGIEREERNGVRGQRGRRGQVPKGAERPKARPGGAWAEEQRKREGWLGGPRRA